MRLQHVWRFSFEYNELRIIFNQHICCLKKRVIFIRHFSIDVPYAYEFDNTGTTRTILIGRTCSTCMRYQHY